MCYYQVCVICDTDTTCVQYKMVYVHCIQAHTHTHARTHAHARTHFICCTRRKQETWLVYCTYKTRWYTYIVYKHTLARARTHARTHARTLYVARAGKFACLLYIENNMVYVYCIQAYAHTGTHARTHALTHFICRTRSKQETSLVYCIVQW